MAAAAEDLQVYYAPDDPLSRGKTFAMMHRCRKQS
jgi:hypothetical protein